MFWSGRNIDNQTKAATSGNALTRTYLSHIPARRRVRSVANVVRRGADRGGTVVFEFLAEIVVLDGEDVDGWGVGFARGPVVVVFGAEFCLAGL